MPELPEVEIQVRQLRRHLLGARIQSLDVMDRLIQLPHRLKGERITGVERRGKFICFRLSGSHDLLAHLRMTGWFETTKPTHYRIAIVTDKTTVYFEDRRRLGVIRAMKRRDLDEFLESLGPEPLSPGFSWQPLKTRRAIKVALLDQTILAGVGNIYASESLWRARIDPRRPAYRLQRKELKSLTQAIVTTLWRAIRLGDAIFTASGQFEVYERHGERCRRCRKETIRRIIQAARSTYFCPRCQH